VGSLITITNIPRQAWPRKLRGQASARPWLLSFPAIGRTLAAISLTMENHRMRPQSWRRDYASRVETILAEEPNITREALAEELAVDADTLDDILQRIRPTQPSRAAPTSVLQRLGSFQ
jgi:hypothetical protein